MHVFRPRCWLHVLLLFGCAAAARADVLATNDAHWRAHMDRKVAVYIIKHVQRANRGLSALVSEHRSLLDKTVRRKIDSVRAALAVQILAPIYRAYPDLRGKDLSQAAAEQEWSSDDGAVDVPIPARRKLLSRSTALRLRYALTHHSHEFLQTAEVFDKSGTPGDVQAYLEHVSDIAAEIGFAASPIYRAYPDLWRTEMRRAFRGRPSRTPDADVQFRKAVPPPGTVKLSASAASQLEALVDVARREGGEEHPVAAVSWTPETRSKGPNDADWIRSGPGLEAGVYASSQVPGDVVETIGRLRIVFSAPDPAMFVGKTIDFQDGKFILRDQ